MSRVAVQTLMDRWINEPGFRAEMRSDPYGVVARSGVSLDEAEMKALGSIDWTLSDEELTARSSAFFV